MLVSQALGECFILSAKDLYKPKLAQIAFVFFM
jgi:hypothetical protein